MTRVLLVGAGRVGARAARQLVETDGVGELLIADRDARRAGALAEGLGDRASVSDWRDGAPPPEGLAAIACAASSSSVRSLLEVSCTRGVPLASCGADRGDVKAALAAGAAVAAAGARVVVGCGLAPGISDVLARHAAAALDAVTEVHVARAGVGGRACEDVLRRARRERPLEWRDGEWIEPRRLGSELVWFPDPIGARDCVQVATGVELLHRAQPGAARCSMRFDAADGRNRARFHRGAEEAWGSARVEVRGRRGSAVETIVYGLAERVGSGAGGALALATASLAGCLPLGPLPPPGVYGLSELVDPVLFLAELAVRGVRAAAFEGVATR